MYEIADPAPLPARPDLPGTVVVRGTSDEAIDAAAADLFIHATNCVRTFGDFHIAMTVDAGAEPLLRRLMYDPACRELPWKRAHLWLVEEFVVPEGDAMRRSTLLHDLVVNPSDIPLNQVHVIDATGPDPDVGYEANIREYLGWREKGHDRLDFVLMGLADAGAADQTGGDAGTARDRLVSALPAAGGDRPVARVAMTPSLISAARFVSVVALGESCREALRRAAGRETGGIHPADPRTILYSGVQPVGGELRWYLDAAACPNAGGATT